MRFRRKKFKKQYKKSYRSRSKRLRPSSARIGYRM